MDVSVIIPVYNMEKYLEACIDSVLQQEDVSLEIILVDDGSKDSSPAICDRYAQNYSNVKTIHIQNSGSATARNEGLKLAQGKYITLTDSDDKMIPKMLSKMFVEAEKQNADIVCCNYQETDEQGHTHQMPFTGQIYVFNHEEAYIHFFAKNKIYSQCWTKLYRRDMLNMYGVRNEPGMRIDDDPIFNIKAFAKAQRVVVVDEPLYDYTIRNGSLARDFYRKNISHFIDCRMKRIQITENAIQNDLDSVKEWGMVNILMYCNELLGKVAMFPEYFTDTRVINIINIIKQNKQLLKKHYTICGFSKWGMLLILYLPNHLYMKYRQSKA